MSSITDVLIPAVTLIVGALFGKRAERRKASAEAEGSEIDNVAKAIKIWRELSEQLQHAVDKLTKEVHSLREENVSLKTQMKELRKTIENK